MHPLEWNEESENCDDGFAGRRGLIDRWVAKHRAGTLVDKPTSVELQLRAENERLNINVAEQVLENDLFKKVMVSERQRIKESSSVVIGRNLVVCAGGVK